VESGKDGPDAKYYYPDAAIWRLYLEEVRAEDKELAEIWKNSLDSLLLFVSQCLSQYSSF
jgi:hypothetical protein